MNGSYLSRQMPLRASAMHAFRCELVLDALPQALDALDITVTVYTSQLSPRLTVIAPAGAPAPVAGTPAYILRAADYFLLVLTPAFLKPLPTGRLTLSISYTKDNFAVTNVLETEKFINDVAICPMTTL